MSFFKSHNLVARRFVPGVYKDGKWIEGTMFKFNFFCSLQPLTPHQIALLPEARREDESSLIITETELRKVSVRNQRNSDIIEIEDELYEVYSVKPWKNKIIPHYEVVVIMLEPEIDE